MNIVPEEGGFAEIHVAHPIPGIDATDPGFIDKDGDAQNAFGTALSYSEFLPQGLYQNVKVPLFEDKNFQAVDGSVNRLKEPIVVVSLPHIDSNGNEEYDNYEEGAPDPAFGTDTNDLGGHEFVLDGREIGTLYANEKTKRAIAPAVSNFVQYFVVLKGRRCTRQGMHYSRLTELLDMSVIFPTTGSKSRSNYLDI